MNLPLDFILAHSEELVAALDSEPVVSLRLNPAKKFECQYQDIVEWCADGRYLAERPSFTLDPVHAAGGYYVQEASSMVVGHIAQQILNELCCESPLVVDLCAAPGGKTTHLSSVVGGCSDGRGVVVANEVIKSRAGILAQNVVRWGEGNTVVTSVEAASLADALSGEVDLLVADVPCSGEGMFRKDMTARGEWSQENVELCAARGRRILSDAKQMLRSGGYLVYSTCTFNHKEDEDNVKWLVDSGEFEVDNSKIGGFGKCGEYGSHFYPNEVRGEGFFVAVLKFIGENRQNRAPKSPKNSKKQPKISKYSTQSLFEVELSGRLFGYSELMTRIVEQLQNRRVYILMAGIEFGELIRGELKPSHNYALYAHKTDTFLKTEVSKEVALEFLRKNNLQATEFCEGLQLVTFQGLPLGFAKRITNRVNNMYPTSWRILC